MPRNALHEAKTLEQLAAALQAGADVDAEDAMGWTAMMFAAGRGDEHAAGILRTLLDAGADVNMQNTSGETRFRSAKRTPNMRQTPKGLSRTRRGRPDFGTANGHLSDTHGAAE